MDITITPNRIKGSVTVIPSKSQAHRYLICAAFADRETTIICPETNKDIEATAACLRSLGASIVRFNDGYSVTPVSAVPVSATLPCGESGSTLRFLLPVIGALGIDGSFVLEGRLSQRPLSPLWEEMEKNGCQLSWADENTLNCQGKLVSGNYSIDGSVSSQFISGLLFALSLIPGTSQLSIVGNVESKPYIDMTKLALLDFGVQITEAEICGQRSFRTPGTVTIEGDWSNGAFFHVANYIGNAIDIVGLNDNSPQGDRAVVPILKQLEQYAQIDVSDIPDLVPILSVAAASRKGAKFCNIRRLRLKESDRVQTVISLLNNLGVKAEADENSLTVYPGKFHGGTVDAANDHRIAMAAGIAATVANGPVTIKGAQCVAKSYPTFWQEYCRLGGTYEQHIR